MMKIRTVVCALLVCLIGTGAKAQEECVGTRVIAKSVMSISRYLVDEMTDHHPQGSIFFVSESEVMTIDHVVRALRLSKESWEQVTISQERDDGYYTLSIRVRVKDEFTDGLPREDGLFTLELERAYPREVEALWLRTTPLTDKEAVAGVGYTAGTLSFAWGHFLANTPRLAKIQYGGPDFQGFELMNEFDRNAIFRGASGGPIVDCYGAVVGVISRVLLQEPSFTTRHIYEKYGIPLVRGHANVWAVPTHPVAGQLPKTSD